MKKFIKVNIYFTDAFTRELQETTFVAYINIDEISFFRPYKEHTELWIRNDSNSLHLAHTPEEVAEKIEQSE